MPSLIARALCLALAFSIPLAVTAQRNENDALARQILKQLIETNTTDSVGSVTAASEAMADRLRAAGFAETDIRFAGPRDNKKNLVLRYRGTGKRKPVLFLGHLDVVEARREDWSSDPFVLLEKDGFFYGRGTQDMKAGDALLVTSFIRLKREGYLPERDLILALTADEEGGSANGVDWLLKNYRDWIEAEYAINLDGGEFERVGGKRLLAGLQASEKVYVDYQFESRNPGGHSSLPSADNAIYHLSAALGRLQNFSFPLNMNEITRNYFRKTAQFSEGQAARDKRDVAGDPPVPEAARKTLQQVAADAKVIVTVVPYKDDHGNAIPTVPVPPSPLLPEVIEAEEKTVERFWPGLPVVSSMSTGATDGRFLRVAGIPTYGIACMFFEVNDNRAHGKDERIAVRDFYDGVEVAYRLIRNLSSPN